MDSPEEGEGMHKLAQECGQAWLGGEDRALDSETIRSPKAAFGPVCQRPGNPQLLQQREDVVVLQVQQRIVKEQGQSNMVLPVRSLKQG